MVPNNFGGDLSYHFRDIATQMSDIAGFTYQFHLTSTLGVIASEMFYEIWSAKLFLPALSTTWR